MPSATSTGASTIAAAAETSAETPAWIAAFRQRSRRSPSIGQRRPAHRMAGVSAAQMYIDASHPIDRGSKGTRSPRYRRITSSRETKKPAAAVHASHTVSRLRGTRSHRRRMSDRAGPPTRAAARF